eukprot:7499470-Alexandrium_andersonii.AAC.1
MPFEPRAREQCTGALRPEQGAPPRLERSAVHARALLNPRSRVLQSGLGSSQSHSGTAARATAEEHVGADAEAHERQGGPRGK